MPEERHVSLFRNGRNQAVRIPREFERGPGLKLENWLQADDTVQENKALP